MTKAHKPIYVSEIIRALSIYNKKKEVKVMTSKTAKAKKIFLEILKWITVLPGIISVIMDAVKKNK